MADIAGRAEEFRWRPEGDGKPQNGPEQGSHLIRFAPGRSSGSRVEKGMRPLGWGLPWSPKLCAPDAQGPP